MFYERYLALCTKKRISPSAAAEQAGFNKGTVSVWKKKYDAGIDIRPRKEVVEKICTFFNCSEAWILGFEGNKKKPTPDNRGERSYADIELAEAFNRADDSTRQAIRLLLGLK